MDSRPVNRSLASEKDPGNARLSYFPVKRLEAEAIRDSLLAVSAQLDGTMYGPPVNGNSLRRSMYVRVQRNSLDPFLRTFDFPEPFAAVGNRDSTNVPEQSLALLNDPFIDRCALQFAISVLKQYPRGSDRQLIERMYLQAFARNPNTEEAKSTLHFLNSLRAINQKTNTELNLVRLRLKQSRSVTGKILQVARDQILQERKTTPIKSSPPLPIARWEFEGNLKDSLGTLHGTAHGPVRFDKGAVVFDGKSAYVETAPLAKDLKEKTLEVWVMLDRLNQGGGGVMNIQRRDGVIFDAIVFGERDPGQWLAGSNGFERTQSFNGSKETQATQQLVHIVIVYRKDGSIQGYRNAQPYGKPYHSSGPHRYKANQSTVLFGLRHSPAIGNRLLAGRVFRAQLYDRALSAEEITHSNGAVWLQVSHKELLEKLPPGERETIEEIESKIHFLSQREQELSATVLDTETELWQQVAKALFNFKEFVYLR